MICVNLTAGTLNIAVMVEQLQPTQELLRTSVHECDDLMRTQKTILMNQPDDLLVTLCQVQGSNCGDAFEAGKAGGHSTILLEVG